MRRLHEFTDLSYIEDYAVKFSLDPDWVYENKSFDTIMLFAIKWKEVDEYQERFQAIERMMTESGQK